jgi:branched-chain amino acid transport system substrate-binding protein
MLQRDDLRGADVINDLNKPLRPPGRRRFLKRAVAAAVAGSLPKTGRAAAPVTVGFVSPETGPLAPFGAADAFVLNSVKAQFAARGINIEVRDSRSDPLHAAAVANQLIDNNVALILVSSTPETVNPVSDQCELAGVPCISTVAPWQAWFFSRGGDPTAGFQFTYHFFWGLEDVIAVYTGMWNQLASNKIVGGLYPNDGDGNAWSDSARGFPPALAAANFKLINTGLFEDLSPDFSGQINLLKSNNTDIVSGILIPPDFITFWAQARQQGVSPKIATIGKALLFPETMNALGGSGNNLSTEVWWTPDHPFASSLTGQTTAELAQAYTQATGKQWTQPLGFTHALCELAFDVLGRAGDGADASAVMAALTATNLKTIVGPISWADGPVKNVCKTPLVGGQWRATPNGPFNYELVVTEAGMTQNIPVHGQMEALV